MRERPSPESLNVSRETFERLAIYVDLLKRWQPSINLVSSASLDDVWARHVGDSLQMLPHVDAGPVVDMGSGAGFPGLVLAMAKPASAVRLIESDGRKCAFLQEVVRRTEVAASVHHGRIESVMAAMDAMPVVVTARGLAPLSKLMTYAALALEKGAVGVFLKGKAWQAELTEARKAWRFAVDILPSRTDSQARILRITQVRRMTES